MGGGIHLVCCLFRSRMVRYPVRIFSRGFCADIVEGHLGCERAVSLPGKARAAQPQKKPHNDQDRERQRYRP